LNEAKLILLGRGGVGKTSLVNRLVHGTFDPNSAKTEGIQITQWPVEVDGESVRLHVWDFGGQDILHATHQFFLTERTLYLVVLSGREGNEDADAEYWFKLVESFGGESPVYVVLNKIDEHPFDLIRRALKQKYPNIREFVATDCKSGRGLKELDERLHGELGRWEARRVAFPASWFAIKERLAGMKESYLSFDRFRQICRELGEGNGAEQDLLAGYLHTLGVALNYKDDPRLRETHVLNPHWVTGGIYRILNAPLLAEHEGVLDVDDLAGILPAEVYPRAMHLFLIDLMRKFELCFPFTDGEGRYLVPELLDKQQPPEAETFAPGTGLGFEYRYPILPEGLLPRFIVRTHAMSEGQKRWRTGVILRLERCLALVKADLQEKTVQVSISGPPDGRRRLLAVIRSDFERIHGSIKDLKPVEMVPVPGRPGLAVPYLKLVALERAGKRTFDDVIGDEVVELDVADLLNGVDLAGTRRRADERLVSDRPLRLFYSYARKDEALRNKLDAHLKILERRGLIAPWYDKLIDPGRDFADEIDENLERADIILLLVSADFIKSDYCYAREMKRALERHEADEADVIPVILRTTNWKGTPFARLNALPESGKPVTRWRDRDSAWTNVSEGIERVIHTWRILR
jgi:internalin A